ncbi:MAG: type VI secretion system contractile sheath domain-containing protein, partial [Solirubrobacteraceae bacterium]
MHLGADLSAPAGNELNPGAFRIAVLGNFSGRARGADALAARRAWRVDRDDVDAVIARLAPELRIVLDPSEPPVAISFSSLDDFHPDALLRRVALFQGLVALRSGKAPPPQSAPKPDVRQEHRTNAAVLDLSGGSLLDRIVDGGGADIATGAARAATPRDELSDFIAKAVRSHTVAETSAEQRDFAAKVDGVITAMMRVLLHHPQYQALEALWRGVDFLTRRLDTSETMQVWLIDASREELVADLAASDAAQTAAHKLTRTFSIVAGAYTFEPGDAELLAKLASIGRATGACWLVAAHPRFVGVDTFADTDADDWALVRSAAWSALRASPAAQHLSVAAPRFLARLPYG